MATMFHGDVVEGLRDVELGEARRCREDMGVVSSVDPSSDLMQLVPGSTKRYASSGKVDRKKGLLKEHWGKTRRSSRDIVSDPKEEKEDGIPQKDGANFPAIEKPQKKQKRQHLRWFGHGKVWTFVALVSGWVGVLFSVLSYRSVEFVHLQQPIRVGALYEPVSSTGMIRMELCFNETVSEYSGS